MELGNGPQCLLCSRPYNNGQNPKWFAGFTNFLKHGRKHMKKIAQIGGIKKFEKYGREHMRMMALQRWDKEQNQ